MVRLAFLTILIIIATNPLIAQNYRPEIDSLIKAYVSLNKFNGTVLVTRKNKILFKSSYGYSNKAKGELISSESIFPIGSLTKSFTAILILKLVSENLISLDDNVSKFIPDYPRGNQITIKHLLSHTSGIFEELRNPDYFQQLYLGKKYSHEEKLDFFKKEPLDFEPGSKFGYSNSGYALLGIIIEKVTEMTYEQNLAKYIFKPLKMKNTGFDYTSISQNNVTGYSYLSDSKNVEVQTANPQLLFSSGALYSNTKDLLKFYKGIKSYKIISKNNLDKATTPFIRSYGFGWFIDTIENDKIVNHAGNIDGFTSYFIMNLKQDICIILLNNITSTSLERIGNSIYRIITEKQYSLPKPKQEIVLSQKALSFYVGHYEISSNLVAKITLENNSLFLQMNNDQKLKLSAEKENFFFIKGEDMEIEFIQSQGKISEIKIKQGLSTKSGDKIS